MINHTKYRLLKVLTKTQIQTGIIESNKNTTEIWINTGSSGKGILPQRVLLENQLKLISVKINLTGNNLTLHI
jgi:hypothetical protein